MVVFLNLEPGTIWGRKGNKGRDSSVRKVRRQEHIEQCCTSQEPPKYAIWFISNFKCRLPTSTSWGNRGRKYSEANFTMRGVFFCFFFVFVFLNGRFLVLRFFFFNWLIDWSLCWVFVSVLGPSLVAASGGHSSSRCVGLSLSRPLLLWSTGSRRAGSVVVAHRPSCSVACGIFPDQGSIPCPLH